MENAHTECQEISQNREIMLLMFEFLSWFGNNNVSFLAKFLYHFCIIRDGDAACEGVCPNNS